MLKDLYTITSLKDEDENAVLAEINIHASSRIFKGHFPGKPIVPGVCQLAMIKDVLERSIKQSTQLQTAKQIKFTDMLLPNKNTEVQLKIEYKKEEKNVQANVSIFVESTTFLKAKLNYQIVG